MATHSSFLAWRIPWTEEPGELLSMELQKKSDTTEQLNNNKQDQSGGYFSSRWRDEAGLNWEGRSLELLTFPLAQPLP